MITLDCTFRDGGYYNGWNFDIQLARDYLTVIEKSGIQAVEIGFRSPPDKQTGSFAKVTDEFIEDNLYTPDVEYFGVMINESDMNFALIKKLFKYSDKAPINLVRVATHFKDINSSEEVVKSLKDLGYYVSMQLMQAADKSFDEIKQVGKKLENWKAIDVLYLADSLGGMNHDSVNYAFKAIKEGWSGLVGFHGHNNKGQALNNSLEAVDIGVDWIDGTMMGMGRGPGNTQTEYLLSELNKRGFGEYEVEDVYQLVLNKFIPLKRKYEWGPSLLYYLTAEYNIHPTYVQKMLSENYSMDNILKAVFYLEHKETNFFNKDLFEGSLK